MPESGSQDSSRTIRPSQGARSFAGASVRTVCIAVAVAMGWLPQAARAQVSAGGHAVYQTGVFDGTYGLGGRAEVALDFLAPGLAVAATYDHFFPDCSDCSAFNAGAQLLVAPPSPLYLGLGADYHRFSEAQGEATADSEWAFNLIVGIRVPVLPVVVPFVELRQQLWSTHLNQQTLSLGVILTPARARTAPSRPRPR